ncbi:MAG: hypothetical protein IPL26_22625 [Leptospiraceae bacterium]|nr:hypothetical protein [Leptospiraceae bacterium]
MSLESMDMCRNKKSNLLHPVPILATPTGAGYELQKLLNWNLFLFSEKNKLFFKEINREMGNVAVEG